MMESNKLIILSKLFLSPPVQHARWAHRHHIPSVVCRLSLDQNYWTIIHILKGIACRAMKLLVGP